MHRLLKLGAAVSMFALPVVTFAQGSGTNGIADLIGRVGSLIAMLVPIVIALAVLVFLWGVLQYVVAKDEDKQKEARSVMLYGVIALFVMVSVWGLVNILGDSINLNKNTPTPPGLPGITR